MRVIVRHLILGALLASAAAGHAPAQTGGSPPDSTIATRTNDSLIVARKSTVSAKSSKLLQAIEITGFLALSNVAARIMYPNDVQDGKKVYSSTFASTADHLRTQHWVYDIDPFNTNQFQHPYQGSMMYGFARSSGHGFWTSLVHADVGSFIWKMAGETDPPSINDMITTGQAGSLLGEALYRMADLVLKHGGEKPNGMHEYAAALISPPGGLNRRIFGDRFKDRLPDTAPSTIWQVRFGATLDALARDVATPKNVLRGDATAEFAMSYGLPGQSGYTYTRPLDYFDFQGTFLLSSFSNFIENIMIRGLLLGGKTAETDNSHGIWGLYGSFDYISPYLFRVSSTALSLGTTRQVLLTPHVALQGSALGGVGYGAAGSTTVIASTPTNAAIRDYHFGLTPQALLALRLILGDRAMLDLTAREYYVSGYGSDDTRGSETIFRGNFGATIRVYRSHAIGIQFVSSTRDAKYGLLPNRKLSEGTVTIVYSILGGNRFSAVAEK